MKKKILQIIDKSYQIVNLKQKYLFIFTKCAKKINVIYKGKFEKKKLKDSNIKMI